MEFVLHVGLVFPFIAYAALQERSQMVLPDTLSELASNYKSTVLKDFKWKDAEISSSKKNEIYHNLILPQIYTVLHILCLLMYKDCKAIEQWADRQIYRITWNFDQLLIYYQISRHLIFSETYSAQHIYFRNKKNPVKKTTQYFALTKMSIFCGVLEPAVTGFWVLLIVKHSSILLTGW